MIVGAGGGLGAVAFRWLIFAVTWLATGREQFGQQGRVGSLHFPWLGTAFLVLIPVVGGLLYGPLIYLFAREARGHGVPEVMIAVATQEGKIRPQVSVVKALASALCIGVGGSVGREGPIVQIGSALASSLGQLAKMPGPKLRVLVACGAAAGISATFNAPVTGVLFGFELILRELAIDALLPMILASVIADLVGRVFFGSAPIFSQMPHDLVLSRDWQYLLVVVLGLAAALIGTGFHAILYKVEDLCDATWKNRPEWARPAVGGILLGLVLLALPQMYGVGYPVMTQAIAGNQTLWLLLILMAGKMFTASLTIGIGGSGGVFAPSLFTGAMAGTAFGIIAGHLLGPAAGPPAIYGIIAMGAVFAAAAQAPLTSIASVVEMTGNYSLMLPVMLAVAVATGLAGQLSYGTIYTRKLLRRGIDIDLSRRTPRPGNGPDQRTAPRTSRAASGPRRQGGARRRHHPSPGHPARPWPAPCHTAGTPAARAALDPSRSRHRQPLANPRRPARRHRPGLLSGSRAGGARCRRGAADDHCLPPRRGERVVRAWHGKARETPRPPMTEATSLTLTVHLFNNLIMSSDPADLTAAAVIRIAAMELFAERGYADVTIRQIAATAGVSPALVIHHYGSKEKLREALEERVAGFVDAMLADLERAPDEGGSASVAELFAGRLEREPAMAGYIRRLLSDGGPAGISLFGRLYQATQAGMRSMEAAGVARPGRDDVVRDAFLLSNDLALVLLRPHIAQVTGIDPLSRAGLVRWSAEVFDVYSNGVFALPADPGSAADAGQHTEQGDARP